MKSVKTSVYLKRRFRRAKAAKGNEGLSFKKFVRKLADGGDTLAEDWFAHKSAHFNDEAKALRKKNKGAKIAAEKNATKLARSKKSKGGGTKVKTAATTTTTTTE
jgi:hypothetical protein